MYILSHIVVFVNDNSDMKINSAGAFAVRWRLMAKNGGSRRDHTPFRLTCGFLRGIIRNMEYTLKRSARRRTVSVEIKGGEVIVHVPLAYDRSSAIRKHTEDFLKAKSKWIERKLEENRRNAAGLLEGFAEGRALYLFGFALNVQGTAKGRSVRFERGILYVPSSLSDERRKRAVVKWYKSYAETELKARLDDISAKTGIGYCSFALTSARGKWGSCSEKGEIRLNYRLTALPDELIEYVIVHELCHMRVMAHSREFWNEVHRFLPDYKELKRELNRYKFVMAAI